MNLPNIEIELQNINNKTTLNVASSKLYIIFMIYIYIYYIIYNSSILFDSVIIE